MKVLLQHFRENAGFATLAVYSYNAGFAALVVYSYSQSSSWLSVGQEIASIVRLESKNRAS